MPGVGMYAPSHPPTATIHGNGTQAAHGSTLGRNHNRQVWIRALLSCRRTLTLSLCAALRAPIAGFAGRVRASRRGDRWRKRGAAVASAKPRFALSVTGSCIAHLVCCTSIIGNRNIPPWGWLPASVHSLRNVPRSRCPPLADLVYIGRSTVDPGATAFELSGVIPPTRRPVVVGEVRARQPSQPAASGFRGVRTHHRLSFARGGGRARVA